MGFLSIYFDNEKLKRGPLLMGHPILWNLVSDSMCLYVIDSHFIQASFSRFKWFMMVDFFTYIACFHSKENMATKNGDIKNYNELMEIKYDYFG